MTTTITITGQINGNSTLLNAIPTYNSETKRLPFNNYQLIFPTKKEAKKALWEAYKFLKSEEPEFGQISYSKYGSLRYDASSAIIN